jgi:membrane peptidoglycan carboxypeptidase
MKRLDWQIIRMRQQRRAQRDLNGSRASQVVFAGLSSVSIVAMLITAVTLTALSVPFSYIRQVIRGLPDPAEIVKAQDNFQTSKIYDRKGQLLYEVIDQNAGDRQWIALNQISPALICATIALEDKSFYENPGFDLRGILRALMSNLQGDAVQGGSGITQQLVKNIIIPEEERAQVSYERKLKELLLSLEVNRRYNKDQILEWYLNTNYYGGLAYGIEAAAQVYFGKNAKNLTLAEAAMIAPIPQFPRLNPFDNLDQAKDRQALVLDVLQERLDSGELNCASTINSTDIETARADTLRYANRDTRYRIVAPHFTFFARDYAVDLLIGQLGVTEQQAIDMVNRQGLRIKTTLDTEMNEAVRQIAANQIAKLQAERKKINNSAVVVIDPRTGEVLAMVGSIDYYNDAIDGKFNVATGLRQPGSSFKPITYIELMRQGATPASIFNDVALTIRIGTGRYAEIYTPKNYDGRFHGVQTLRASLANSYNIPAVKAIQQAGVGNVIRTAHQLGITDLSRGLEFYGPSLTLGGGEVKLLDLTYAYATIDNGGTMIGALRPAQLQKNGYRLIDPTIITEITDAKGNVIYRHQPAWTNNLLGDYSQQLAYQITSILSDNEARKPMFGNTNPLELKRKRPAAVKTGTTNDNRDNWTVGYTPQFVVGVWAGNTDNKPMDPSVTGVTGAAPIWHDVMEYLHADLKIEPFERPPNIITRDICKTDGGLPRTGCASIKENFIPSTEPISTGDAPRLVAVNRLNGLASTIDTPRSQTVARVLYLTQLEGKDWVKYANPEVRSKFALPLPDIKQVNFAGAFTRIADDSQNHWSDIYLPLLRKAR